VVLIGGNGADGDCGAGEMANAGVEACLDGSHVRKHTSEAGHGCISRTRYSLMLRYSHRHSRAIPAHTSETLLHSATSIKTRDFTSPERH